MALLVAVPARAAEGSLTMDQAVATALRRNRDVIAARLEIRAAELDQVAAQIYPNPVLSYVMGNVTVGAGNPGNTASGAPANPGFTQTVQSIGISEIIDIWSKRGARMRVADRGLEVRRLQVADALRTIVHAVRSAFAEVEREQSERQLSRDVRGRYDETIRLSRARFSAGEISEAELRKIELEALKYQTDVVNAETEYDIARQKLAALLGMGSQTDMPDSLAEDAEPDVAPSIPELTAKALEVRPDLLAAERAHVLAEAGLSAARREALPDITLGITYTHSEFLASGDNPNTFAFGVSLPLPIFDRNQANIGRAQLDMERANNEAARIAISIRQEVAEAARRVERAKSLLDVFQGGGMLDRAETSLRVAEKSYKAGAISLLELLEAQRTFLSARAEYLRAQYDNRQARIDLGYAVGGEFK
jgi:cobalt-zinc-cadmium efflux system outer membrane protein